MGAKRKLSSDGSAGVVNKKSKPSSSSPSTTNKHLSDDKPVTLSKKKSKRNGSTLNGTKASSGSVDAKPDSSETAVQTSIAGHTKSKTSSCMKHKKKDKHRDKKDNDETAKSMTEVKNKTDQKMKTTKVQLPSSAEEMSSNWRKLQSSDKSLRKKKMKKSHKKKYRKLDSVEIKHSLPDSPPEIWFDDVDDILLDTRPKKTESVMQTNSETSATSNTVAPLPKDPLVKAESFTGMTKVLAMDCEMVGVGEGGKDSVLARVSIVNQYGQCVYDQYVRPTEPVTDYRTHVSGIRREDVENAVEFEVVQKEVSDILHNRILVGHAIHNDFKVLYLSHPKRKIRDTLRYKPFVALFNGRRPSLKKLSERVLSVKVQEGEHSSVQDAQAAMRLYTMHRKQWERDLKEKFSGKSRT